MKLKKHVFKLSFFLLLFLIATANYFWHRYGGWQLPHSLYKQRVEVVGRIASLPQHNALGTSFLFKVEEINGAKVDSTIRLTGYVFNDKKQSGFLSAGDRWQFVTHLKPIHGLHNFDAFDYERNLALQGVRASGYIVANADNHCLLHDPYHYPLLYLRQNIQQKIEANLIQYPAEAAIISAVTVGSVTSMTNEQWKVFQLTGTGHLLSISSLPICLIAVLGFVFFKSTGKIFPRIYLIIPAPHLAAVGGFVFAFIYSALAGFAWPVQRSLIMVFSFALAQLLYRSMPLWRRLAFAAVLILVIEPAGIFSVGFILSFSAVVCLCYGLGGRLQAYKSFRQSCKMQWVIFVGLLPITLLYFKQVSLVMLVANFIAIPWVTWLIVPISLTACFCLLFSDALAHYLLIAAAYLLKILWLCLEYFSHWPLAAWHHYLGGAWMFVVLTAGAFLLIAPAGFPGRALAFIWMGLLLFYQPEKPRLGEWWLTLLDVGQGLALVVQTAKHVMVYDTGVRFPGAFDAGRDVVVPFLESRGIQEVDLLVISHGDNDHSGGAEAIISAMRVRQIISSIPAKFRRWGATACYLGQEWQWEGLNFKVLSPPPGFAYEDNNSSCVIRVSLGPNSVLLPGDIERPTERYLLEKQADDLASTVLIAPHHGSKSSSIKPFIEAVSAKVVLFATGFLNRYRFPNPKVVSLYSESHAKMYSSARDGAIQLRFDAKGQLNINTVVKNKNELEL